VTATDKAVEEMVSKALRTEYPDYEYVASVSIATLYK
jgi:hypothetical protein